MPIHQTNSHIVTALLEDLPEARSLAGELRKFGVPDENISIISSGRHYDEDQYKDLEQSLLHEHKHHTEEGMEAGALVGGTGGFIVGLGMITVPGLGPLLVVGGLLASAITGAAAGGMAGGLVGALADLKVPEDKAKMYGAGVDQGRVLIVFKATADNVRELVDLVASYKPVELEQRVDLWEVDRMREPSPRG